MADWAEYLMWCEDARFAHHQYFKFIVHNIISRKKTLEQSTYIVKQQLGENPLSLSDLKEQLQNGNDSLAKRILYFGASLRGTSQYRSQRNRELRSLIQYQIHEGKGLPSFFTTGSCAEYYFKTLKTLLENYMLSSTGQNFDLADRNTLFTVLQKNTHVISHYFDLRTKSYFDLVMSPAFGVDSYWYRMEFAKSRGMIHWHGLCWRSDREPHNLLYEAIQKGLNSDQSAEQLSHWAKNIFGMTALHPAGTDETGSPRKDLWPPPEGTAPIHSDDDGNPLFKLLMDVSASQQSLLEDHLQLTNKINIHRCSDYCLRQKGKQKMCRMEFGTALKPGKMIRDIPAIGTDRNGSMRLEMARDHPMMVQHSRYHTQGWRANGDISLMLSQSSPENPSVNEIISAEKYVSGYACKGNEGTGAMVDLFKDIVENTDDNENSTKSACNKLLMNSVKRDISSMEAAYELLSLPLYRCSHQIQSISLSGSRVLEKSGKTFTKSTPLDRYLSRPHDQKCSWYKFICDQGKVPVINATSVYATWPLNEEYCRTMLLLHWPSWRSLLDIKPPEQKWIEIMNAFLKSNECPNFVKADIERAKRHESEDFIAENDSDYDSENDTNLTG